MRSIQLAEKRKGKGQVAVPRCFVNVPFAAYYFRYSISEFLSADWAKRIPCVMVKGDLTYYSDVILDRLNRRSLVTPNYAHDVNTELRYGPPVLLNAEAAGNGLALSRRDFAGIAESLPHFDLVSVKLYDGRLVAATTKYWLNWPPGSSEVYMEPSPRFNTFLLRA